MTAAPPRPQQETAADTNSSGTPHRHTAGTRPEHGALVRRKYGLLALAGTAVDPSNVGYQEIGDIHEATGADSGREGAETPPKPEKQRRKAAATATATVRGWAIW